MAKLTLDLFSNMTSGHMNGLRILGRYGTIKVNTYHRFIEGFMPHYISLASQGADSNIYKKANPPLALIASPNTTTVRSKAGKYPIVMIANESDSA